MTIAAARPRTTGSAATPGVVRFGRRSTRGVLLGLSGPRLVSLAVALLIVVPAVYSAGIPGVVVTAPGWGLAVAVASVSVAGRHAAEWVPVYGHWLLRRALRQNVYGVRVLVPRPAVRRSRPPPMRRLRERSGSFAHPRLSCAMHSRAARSSSARMPRQSHR